MPQVNESTSNPEPQKKSGHDWPEWHRRLTAFQQPNDWRAVWQLINTLVPYGCLWGLMVRSIHQGRPYWVALLLALPAAAFLVRTFILFHDCVHMSLFTHPGVNRIVGHVLGVLVFTPFEEWRFSHLRHHGRYANLDARGVGDIWTLTLQEYSRAPWWTRLRYRLYRNPLVLFGLGALFVFLLDNRFPSRGTRRKERMSVLLTNLLIVGVILVMCRLIGWRTTVLVQLPILWLASVMGVWLFYVQHQFPGGYWARSEQWQPLRAAMEGCSFYKLPAVLNWLSGSIGFHHIHHLNPRIPNYYLKACYDAVPELRATPPLTLGRSLSCLRLRLWDEQRGHMVGIPKSLASKGP